MTIDLQPFCGEDHDRWYLMKPLSFGDYTYATNGHIVIRVTRRVKGWKMPPK